MQLTLSRLLIAYVLLVCGACHHDPETANAQAEAVQASTPVVEIFSGSFNPPHLGHRSVALDAAKQVHATVAYVIPNLTNPKKPELLPYATRKEMIALTFRDTPVVKVPDAEIEAVFQRDNIEPLLKLLRARHPGAKFHVVLGDDVFERTGMATFTDDADLSYLVAYRRGSTAFPTLKYSHFDVFHPGGRQGCSSFKVRKALAAAYTQDPCLDPAVWQYIQGHGLYRHM